MFLGLPKEKIDIFVVYEREKREVGTLLQTYSRVVKLSERDAAH
jgi:hypothetical protein